VLPSRGQRGDGRISDARTQYLVPASRVQMPTVKPAMTFCSVLRAQTQIAAAEQYARASLHECSLQKEFVGEPLVVGIIERQQRIARCGDSAVARRADPAMPSRPVTNPIEIR